MRRIVVLAAGVLMLLVPTAAASAAAPPTSESPACVWVDRWYVDYGFCAPRLSTFLPY